MSRKIRISLAALCFSLVTLLFLDFTGSVHAWAGWTAKLQLLPALLALDFGIIALLAVLTFIMGRIYCSVICPLGVLQDIISWLHSRRRGRCHRFYYSPTHSLLRYAIFAICIAALVCGVSHVVTLLAPYSTYGRFVSCSFSPLYRWMNNLLAGVAERFGSYAIHTTEILTPDLSVIAVTSLTFIVILLMAWRTGRTWCNAICPVGTLLSFIARHSLFRPVIDRTACKDCGLCARSCKSSCIDIRSHTIDLTRCVACMDCIGVCRHHALHYSLRRSSGGSAEPADTSSRVSSGTLGPVDSSRRSFLVSSALIAAAVAEAQEKKVDGGLALILDKCNPERNTPILPPGARSRHSFAWHCTACQLCVSVCPNNVLRPSTEVTRLMQPEMSYTVGYCRPECTRCSDVCPTGALRLAGRAEKSSLQIGHAVPLYDNCVVVTDHVPCGNCARHCPAGAVTMVAMNTGETDSLKVPVVDIERCIGCGACENLCPARPLSAIYVEGHEVQRFI